MTTEAASIMLVDDHPLLRKGLKQLIAMEDDMKVVAEASSGLDALKLAEEYDPDLIVLDLNMQGMDGIQTLKRLRDKGVSSRIIILTVSDADDDVVAAITNGADGYLLKDMEPELLLEQIHRAVTGKMVLSEAITEILATALRQPKSVNSPLSSLTNREYEILSLIAQGMSNKMIARELDISDGTVKVHVKHLLKKLGLRSRVEAAVWMVNQQDQ
ncbi:MULTISPECIES: two-component system response regulator NarL [Idiomarina]|jgi:two-component system nitrate/nitrite response regulator NarL|uniref:Transcriptional regulator NarL n=2 Tax=Idiomarina TaxID=135575 RepID=A0A837NG99_9GAMM|nr:two-component system response regulator NarL [Idiomarina zobellii]KPD23165.1 transcriptional regulator NarL [Idiomarina zobellii]MBF38872.1 two-component system response regulator NarL [Idiomarinaceae bacterium]RUO64514.1 two-component system response regulator NarL [Idiomarina piscisalsi]SDG15731.1 two component transcriptional regulator, LuxR family [Idiomarina zobellii]|tara:strand:+ start:22931 stop:23575 length:645 start_codon:yes stop_codon:yes gene_type:complete